MVLGLKVLKIYTLASSSLWGQGLAHPNPTFIGCSLHTLPSQTGGTADLFGVWGSLGHVLLAQREGKELWKRRFYETNRVVIQKIYPISEFSRTKILSISCEFHLLLNMHKDRNNSFRHANNFSPMLQQKSKPGGRYISDLRYWRICLWPEKMVQRSGR